MAEVWEPTPPYYASLDLRRLLAGAIAGAGSSAGAEIREVDMEGEEEGGPVAVAAAAAEDADGSARPAAASRWAALEDEDAAAAAVRAKRSRAVGTAWPANRDTTNGAVVAKTAAVDDWRDLLGRQATIGGAPSPKPRGIIGGQRALGGGGKRVRWPDEATEEASGGGFCIGGLSQQLENVYVLEGLGPPPQDGATGGAAAGHPASFAEAARAERQAEASLDFRKILLGRGGAA